MEEPYKEYAEKFIPDEIRYLLIAESPPHTPVGERLRYFYNYNNSSRSQILLSSVAFTFLARKFNAQQDNKKQFLTDIAEKGVFLIDATYEPINRIEVEQDRLKKIKQDYGKLKKNILSLPLRDDTKFLLVHNNVIKAIGDKLSADFGNYEINDIGFPSYYHDRRFKKKILDAIEH